jgi:hypothetical protein
VFALVSSGVVVVDEFAFCAVPVAPAGGSKQNARKPMANATSKRLKRTIFMCHPPVKQLFTQRPGLRENEITILQGNENFGVVPKGLVSGILLPPYGPTRNMPSLGSDLIS